MEAVEMGFMLLDKCIRTQLLPTLIKKKTKKNPLGLLKVLHQVLEVQREEQ